MHLHSVQLAHSYQGTSRRQWKPWAWGGRYVSCCFCRNLCRLSLSYCNCSPCRGHKTPCDRCASILRPGRSPAKLGSQYQVYPLSLGFIGQKTYTTWSPLPLEKSRGSVCRQDRTLMTQVSSLDDPAAEPESPSAGILSEAEICREFVCLCFNLF